MLADPDDYQNRYSLLIERDRVWVVIIRMAVLHTLLRTVYSQELFLEIWEFYVRHSDETRESISLLVQQMMASQEATRRLLHRPASLYTGEWRSFVHGYVEVIRS